MKASLQHQRKKARERVRERVREKAREKARGQERGAREPKPRQRRNNQAYKRLKQCLVMGGKKMPLCPVPSSIQLVLLKHHHHHHHHKLVILNHHHHKKLVLLNHHHHHHKKLVLLNHHHHHHKKLVLLNHHHHHHKKLVLLNHHHHHHQKVLLLKQNYQHILNWTFVIIHQHHQQAHLGLIWNISLIHHPKELPKTEGEPPSNEALAAIEQQEEVPAPAAAASPSNKMPLQEPLAEASQAPSNEVVAERPTIEEAPLLQEVANSEEVPAAAAAAASSSNKRPLEQEAEASQVVADEFAEPPPAPLDAPELPEEGLSMAPRASGSRGPKVFSSPEPLQRISPPGCKIRLNRLLALQHQCQWIQLQGQYFVKVFHSSLVVVCSLVLFCCMVCS